METEHEPDSVPPRVSHAPPSTLDLLEAAKANDDEQLPQLLDLYDTDIDVRTEDGFTALHLAVCQNHLRAIDALLENGADTELETQDTRRPLFSAVELNFEDAVAALLRHDALIDVDSVDLMPLHMAVINCNTDVAQLLLNHGADINARTTDSKDPLLFAVMGRDTKVVQLLLDRGADPDAFYSDGAATALHQASENGDSEIITALLNSGAKVDPRDYDGATPLFQAVQLGHSKAVEVLIQRGAKTRIWRSDGHSVLDLAEGDEEMLNLLQGETVVQGPRMQDSGNQAEQAFTMLRPSPPPPMAEKDQMIACRGFDAIVVSFFTSGEHEQMIPKEASVYELLYSQGPEAIRSQLGDRNPDFTWYHLPTNNMVWAETLIRRLAAEKGNVSAEMYEEAIPDLELVDSTKRKSRGSKSRLSTLRSQCRRVEGPSISTKQGFDDNIVSFVPFLHAETYVGYDEMTKAMDKATKKSKKTTRGPPVPPEFQASGAVPVPEQASSEHLRRRQTGSTQAPSGLSSSSNSSSETSQIIKLSLWKQALSAWASVRDKLVQRRTVRDSSSEEEESNTDPDLERQANGQSQEERRWPSNQRNIIAEGKHSEEKDAEPALQHSTSKAASQKSLPREESLKLRDESIKSLKENAPSINSRKTTSETGEERTAEPSGDKNDEPGVGANDENKSTKSKRTHGTESDRRSKRSGMRDHNIPPSGRLGRIERTRIPRPSSNLNEHLILGYYRPGKQALQPRRTLDQYGYADIETKSHRDDDQVVYRYTNAKSYTGPKIFMVDQLWLWVLGKDTIITCSPLQWNAWIPRGIMHFAAPTIHKPKMTFFRYFVGHQQQATKNQQAGPMISFNARPTKKKRKTEPRTHKSSRHHHQSRHHHRSYRETDTEGWPELIPNDPMSVPQRVTTHLSRHGRQAVGSVHELASLITTCCVEVFDPIEVPDDYLFFDFFEKSIGRANDKVASYLREFKEAVSELRDDINEPELLSITDETELMIEVEDILDELHTLKMVLRDQERVIGDMNNILQDVTEKVPKHPRVGKRILETNLLRIERMEEAAKKADTSLHRLMDLKQKQASLAEAWYARSSAKDTAKQGKTVIVFTVVTILFLPVSFITSVFTIETTGFPLNKDGKIPFDYVMKCILTIGLALSVPLIIIAFNVDRIADFIYKVREKRLPWGEILGTVSVLGIVAAILAPIWTSELASSAKVATTVALVVIGMGALIGLGISKLYNSAQRMLLDPVSTVTGSTLSQVSSA